MDPFSYLVVLTSIILGLGVTRLVGGLGSLMQSRKRSRPYWIHTLWMINLLLSTAIVWWFAYRWRANERWTFLLFLWLLVAPINVYLIASLLYPDRDEGGRAADWRTYYYENHRDIFLLLALLFPLDIIDTLLKGMAHFHEQGGGYFITMALWFTLGLVAAWTKNPRFHGFFAVIFAIYNIALIGSSLITDQTGFNLPSSH